jgi:hypothetical protein
MEESTYQIDLALVSDTRLWKLAGRECTSGQLGFKLLTDVKGQYPILTGNDFKLDVVAVALRSLPLLIDLMNKHDTKHCLFIEPYSVEELVDCSDMPVVDNPSTIPVSWYNAIDLGTLSFNEAIVQAQKVFDHTYEGFKILYEEYARGYMLNLVTHRYASELFSVPITKYDFPRGLFTKVRRRLAELVQMAHVMGRYITIAEANRIYVDEFRDIVDNNRTGDLSDRITSLEYVSRLRKTIQTETRGYATAIVETYRQLFEECEQRVISYRSIHHDAYQQAFTKANWYYQQCLGRTRPITNSMLRRIRVKNVIHFPFVTTQVLRRWIISHKGSRHLQLTFDQYITMYVGTLCW